jgi:uncharacterized protein YceK
MKNIAILISAFFVLIMTGCGTWMTQVDEAVNNRINSQEQEKTDKKREKIIYDSNSTKL